jgi:hypothetical protein
MEHMKVIWGVGIRWSKESQRFGELGDNKDFQFGMSGGELYSEGNQFLLFRLESKFAILKHQTWELRIKEDIKSK